MIPDIINGNRNFCASGDKLYENAYRIIGDYGCYETAAYGGGGTGVGDRYTACMVARFFRDATVFYSRYPATGGDSEFGGASVASVRAGDQLFAYDFMLVIPTSTIQEDITIKTDMGEVTVNPSNILHLTGRQIRDRFSTKDSGNGYFIWSGILTERDLKSYATYPCECIYNNFLDPSITWRNYLEQYNRFLGQLDYSVSTGHYGQSGALYCYNKNGTNYSISDYSHNGDHPYEMSMSPFTLVPIENFVPSS